MSQKRIIILLILATLSAGGIFVFQAYWLYDSYQVQKEQLRKDINQAMQTALNKELVARLDLKLNQQDTVQTFSSHLQSLMSGVLESAADKMNLRTFKYKFQQNRPADTTDEKPLSVIQFNMKNDSLEKQLKENLSVLLRKRAEINRPLLDSLLAYELTKRDINTDYKLTFSSVDSSQTETHTSNFASRKIQPWWADTKFIQAELPNQQYYILLKMSFSLVASLLLIVITLFSYGFMLKTIFNQKKLSIIKNDFISNMTHEFKTPIATVSAAIEALQRFNVLEDRKRTENYLQIAAHELNHLSKMVNKILQLAIHKKGKLQFTYESINPVRLLKTIVDQNNMRFNEDALICFNDNGVTEKLYADRTHLTNAMQNLIDNAIKYSKNPAEVDLSITEQNGRIFISVKDNGPGIPNQYQDKIFEKFYRIPLGNVHNVKGFGLGLSYVKQVTEQHGGTISVESDGKKGTQFVIQLPIISHTL